MTLGPHSLCKKRVCLLVATIGSEESGRLVERRGDAFVWPFDPLATLLSILRLRSLRLCSGQAGEAELRAGVAALLRMANRGFFGLALYTRMSKPPASSKNTPEMGISGRLAEQSWSRLSSLILEGKSENLAGKSSSIAFESRCYLAANTLRACSRTGFMKFE